MLKPYLYAHEQQPYIYNGFPVVSYDVDPSSSYTTGTLDTVKPCITV